MSRGYRSVLSRGLTGNEHRYLIVLTRALTDDEKRVYECAESSVNG